MAGSRGAQTDLPRSEPAAAPCPGNVPGAAAAPPGPAGPGATIEQQRHLAGEVSPTAAAPRGRAGPDRDGQGWAETGRDVQGWAEMCRDGQCRTALGSASLVSRRTRAPALTAKVPVVHALTHRGSGRAGRVAGKAGFGAIPSER